MSISGVTGSGAVPLPAGASAASSTSSSSTSGRVELQVGDAGPEVKTLQESLSRLAGLTVEEAQLSAGEMDLPGYTLSESGQKLVDVAGRLAADGTFGRDTASAVATFQTHAGLTPSGIADSATLDTLDDAIAKCEAEIAHLKRPRRALDAEAVVVDTPDGPKTDHAASAKANLEAAAMLSFTGGAIGGIIGVGSAVLSTFALAFGGGTNVGPGTMMLGATAVGASFGLWDLGQAGYHAVMAGLGAGYQEA